MSAADKRVNASELRLNPPHVNKITKPHATLKQSLRKTKHSQTAVCMLRTNPETLHVTMQPGTRQYDQKFLLQWTDCYIPKHVWNFASDFDKRVQIFLLPSVPLLMCLRGKNNGL
jgi:hypothetical protein